MMWIGYLLVSRYRTATPEFKRQILLMGVGIEFFLFSFFTILYLATQLATWAIV
jgi:hypothetical protein